MEVELAPSEIRSYLLNLKRITKNRIMPTKSKTLQKTGAKSENVNFVLRYALLGRFPCAFSSFSMRFISSMRKRLLHTGHSNTVQVNFMFPTRFISPQASEKSKSLASGDLEFSTLLSVVTFTILSQSGQK
jgi:hypothetical protein